MVEILVHPLLSEGCMYVAHAIERFTLTNVFFQYIHVYRPLAKNC